MPDEPIKISEMGQIPALASGDAIPILDDSAGTPSAKNKYMILSQLRAWLDIPVPVTLPDEVSQAEAEAGTSTAARLWTPQRVAQAIAELETVTTLPEAVTQAEAEVGTVTAARTWTPQRVAQAIAALAGGASLPDVVTQAEAEAGTVTEPRTWTPQRVAQAIAALAEAAALPNVVTQAEAEAGTVTAARTWTPQRVAQAITELAPAAAEDTFVIERSYFTDGAQFTDVGNHYILTAPRGFEVFGLGAEVASSGGGLTMRLRRNGVIVVDTALGTWSNLYERHYANILTNFTVGAGEQLELYIASTTLASGNQPPTGPLILTLYCRLTP